MALIAGVDEAGRGPWAGPVIAAAVILGENHGIDGLRDSKKLTEKKRETLYEEIMQRAISVSIGEVGQKEIDNTNILIATHKAMQKALGSCNPQPEKALIDGYELPNQILPNKGVIKGDDKVDSIRAASIIAKVTRDRIMHQIGIIFPEYGFSRHKGYGTSKHRAALEKFKATPCHRLTYKPVKPHYPTLKWYRENKRIGWLGERLAALHLYDKGHQILVLNETCGRNGELDIISRKGKDLIFTEVKTVTQEHYTPPAGRIDDAKAKKMENSIHYYTQKEQWQGNIGVNAITVDLTSGKPVISHYEEISLS